jgi:hypothetical protein
MTVLVNTDPNMQWPWRVSIAWQVQITMGDPRLIHWYQAIVLHRFGLLCGLGRQEVAGLRDRSVSCLCPTFSHYSPAQHICFFTVWAISRSHNFNVSPQALNLGKWELHGWHYSVGAITKPCWADSMFEKKANTQLTKKIASNTVSSSGSQGTLTRRLFLHYIDSLCTSNEYKIWLHKSITIFAWQRTACIGDHYALTCSIRPT